MILNTLCVFGTRPEAIKMAPLIKMLNENQRIDNKICVTGQHQQMLDSVLKLFRIAPDYNLQVMSDNQDLCSVTSKILNGLADLFKHYKPELIFIHGDTTTTLTASLAAYYHRIPVAHIEAGLRTGNIYSPWPEEANRKLASSLSKLHFAPTEQSRLNLLKEGVNPDSIFVTGNTVIDALLEITEKLEVEKELDILLKEEFPFLTNGKKTILVTGHRRENFGTGFERICQALIKVTQNFSDVQIVYPVHLNPNVQKIVHMQLKDIDNIYLIPPVDYLSFVYLMKKSYIILTDSGGVQEEAPSLGKPVLVMRETTERQEAVSSGTVRLVGSQVYDIVDGVSSLLRNETLYKKMSQAKNPYGDGLASKRIVNIILNTFGINTTTYPNVSLEGDLL